MELAWAISMSPAYNLYKEPITKLDPIAADSINELINKLKMDIKITSIAVTPDEIKNSSSEIIQRFIRGRAEGTMTNF